ncbi:MAG TPA: DUF2177 family protein [Caulobacteraceae bacterium]|jgi:uncharacterized membrane protein
MLPYLAAYGAAALAFVAADAVWLTLAGPRLYRPVLGPLLAEQLNGAAAIAFYLVYLFGVVALAVAPALRTGQWRTAAWTGLVLGLVAYGTYDLTNQATLRLWATRLTVIDMTWGGALTALAATLGFLAARKAGG